MKKACFLILIIFIGSVCGCNFGNLDKIAHSAINSNATSSTSNKSPNLEMQEVKPSMEKSTNDGDDVALVSRLGPITLREGAVTLQEIGDCLNQPLAEVVSKFGGDPFKNVIYDNDIYKWFNVGNEISFISYSPDSEQINPQFTFAELNIGKSKFAGIDKTMNYMQIQNILGKTKIREIERGLPGSSTSYELWYIINDVKLKFSSLNSDGTDFVIKVVSDFNPEYEYINITHEALDKYFLMDGNQLKSILGISDNGQYYYKTYNAMFYINKRVSEVVLNSNYEIDGIRIGMNISEVEKKLGKPSKVRKDTKHEDDNPPWIEYKYKHFKLIYKYLIGENIIERLLYG